MATAAVALTSAMPIADSAVAAAIAPDDSTAVPVGGGSYAAAPPTSLDRPGHDVTGVVNKK
ncbi:MAG TPA: hypothetical protein VGP24_08415, partial [Glaciihabitans sp.]|nr:hypothetical protein [Glaciihabitans sp.]